MGRINNSQLEDAAIDVRKLNFAKFRRYSYDRFQNIPRAAAGTGHGAPTGATGNTNVLITGAQPFGGAFYEYHIKGTQTILVPSYGASGLDISMDQTDNDGVEYTYGILSSSRHAHVVGTDPPSFTRLKLSIADVSGTDDCCFGWRKAEAYQANVDDYDEAAWLNVNAGTIQAETILNTAATVTTSSGQVLADAGTVTLEVRIDGRQALFLINGAQAPLVPSFNFDSAEVLVPFFFFLHSADVAGVVNLIEWETGPMTSRSAV